MAVQVETITRHSIRNYGSFLQSLATQELLRQAGAATRFVDYRQSNVDDTGWSFAARGRAAKAGRLGIAMYATLRHSNVKKMGDVFEKAITENLSLSSLYRTNTELTETREFESSSHFCVGSDQVWNISYNIDNRPYYLDFAPRMAKKFSLSSSIGMERLPLPEERSITRALASFAGVSVREAAAAEYLDSLGIPAEHHVDPVLGVEPAFWENFAGTRDSDDAPYILVYQLNPSDTIPVTVQTLSRQLRLPVRRIEYWKYYRRRTGGRQLVLPTPQEFVSKFRDAAFVVTDSFHGVSFSTIFNRPFVTVAPPKFGGRIDSLLTLTDRSDLSTTDPMKALEIAREFSTRPDPSVILRSEQTKIREYLEKMISVE